MFIQQRPTSLGPIKRGGNKTVTQHRGMLGNNFRDKEKRADEEGTEDYLKSGERRMDVERVFLHQAGLMDHPLYTQEIISASCPPFPDVIN